MYESTVIQIVIIEMKRMAILSRMTGWLWYGRPAGLPFSYVGLKISVKPDKPALPK